MQWYRAEQAYQALGFRDMRFRVLGYLVAAPLIPVIFFPDDTQHGWIHYVIAVFMSWIHCLFYWEGNRQIIIYFRLRYPRFKEVWQRLLRQFWGITAYSVVVAIVLKLVLGSFRPPGPDKGFVDSIGYAILVGLSLTYLCILFYECVYFFQQWRRSVIEAERLKLQQVQTQLESLKNQVNPHFLFNSLNTLTTLIPKAPDQAISFVQHLSKVYRYVLELNATQLIPLKKELDFVQAYAFLLHSRHRDKLHIHVHIPESYRQQLIVPLALQILIENAVKHNVVSAQDPLHIAIEAIEGGIRVSNKRLPKRQALASTGLGLNNIRTRYRLLADRDVVVEKSADRFEVFLPLIPQVQTQPA